MKFNVLAILILSLILITACSPQEKVEDATQLPSEQEIDAMTEQEKLEAMEDFMEKNPPGFISEQEMMEEKSKVTSMEDGNVLKSGMFEGRAHPTSGGIKIIEKDGKKMVVLSDDFMTDAGPFLVVILAEDADPQSSNDLHHGDYINLGKLKSTSGSQAYELPQDGNYNTAVIYCKPFKVLFGVAKLQ